jgi:hypothetical protein
MAAAAGEGEGATSVGTAETADSTTDLTTDQITAAASPETVAAAGRAAEETVTAAGAGAGGQPGPAGLVGPKTDRSSRRCSSSSSSSGIRMTHIQMMRGQLTMRSMMATISEYMGGNAHLFNTTLFTTRNINVPGPQQ